MNVILSNKKIRLNYFVLDKYEVGISLKGTEVKSIMKANTNIDEAFVIFQKNEAFIINMYVTSYLQGNINNVEIDRKRKLLLHYDEIIKLQYKTKKEKLAIIPLNIHLRNGKIKLDVGLCKSKNARDKRNDLKIRSINKNINKMV